MGTWRPGFTALRWRAICLRIISTVSELHSHSAQVLLVEDDDSAREIFAKALRMTGYHVRTAADGLAGLRLLEAFEPDVVVVDLVLPIASGFEVLDELRAVERTQTISGQRERTPASAIQPGILRYSAKPFDPQSLVRMVDRAHRYTHN